MQKLGNYAIANGNYHNPNANHFSNPSNNFVNANAQGVRQGYGNNMGHNMGNNMGNNQQYRARNNNNNNVNGFNNTNRNNGGGNGGRGPTKDTWKSPFQTRDMNILFFMYSYKVDPCPARRNCPSKVTCPGWHHEGEKRRNPGDYPNYNYTEEPCPHVKPQGSTKWQPPSRCTNGDDCPYSHTLLEQMYHPNIYKTSMCINFTNPRGNKCQWGYYCTHAHGAEDIRNPTENSSSKDARSQGNGSVGNASDGSGHKNDKRNNLNIPGPNNANNHFPHRHGSDGSGMMSNQFAYHRMSPQFAGNQGMNQPMNPMGGQGGPARHSMYPNPNPQHGNNQQMKGNRGSPYQGSNNNSTNGSGHQVPQSHYHQAQGSPQQSNHSLPHPTHPPMPPNPDIHDQYRQIQRQSRPYSTSAPPLPENNYIRNQFTHSPHQSPLLEDSMMPDPYMAPYGQNPPPLQGLPHGQQDRRQYTTHQGLPPQPRPRRSQSFAPGDSRDYHLPKLDAMTIPPPVKTTGSELDGIKGLIIKNTPPPPTRRPHSRSLPLRPEHFILNDALWTAPGKSAENGKTSRQGQRAQVSLTEQRCKSDGASSQVVSRANQQLPSVPDNNAFVDCLLSPNTLDDIITPKQEVASNGTLSPADASKKHAVPPGTWDVFGYSKEEVTSPVDVTAGTKRPNLMKSRAKSAAYATVLEAAGAVGSVEKPSLSNRASLKLPEKSDSKDHSKEIQQLQQKLEAAMMTIETLKKGRGKEEEEASAKSSPLEDASKKSVNMFTDKNKVDLSFTLDDMKSEETDTGEGLSAMKQPPVFTQNQRQAPPLTDLQQQQLARYQHFITCPSCHIFDQNTPRNQVLVPCGHLLCTKCAGGNLKTCPLCQRAVESQQTLVIG